MLKPLKKKSKRFIVFKYKLKEFIKKQLLIYIIVLCSIALCSFIFNKWIEGLSFCISHICIRPAFDRQFHFNKMAYCFILTEVIIWFSIPITLPLSVSLLSSIPVAFFICLFGYYVADRIKEIEYNKILNQRVDELLVKIDMIENVNIFSMTEDELRNYAKSKGLSETICDTLVLKVVHNYRWVDIQKELNFSKDGIRYHKEQIIKKLRIDI